MHSKININGYFLEGKYRNVGMGEFALRITRTFIDMFGVDRVRILLIDGCDLGDLEDLQPCIESVGAARVGRHRSHLHSIASNLRINRYAKKNYFRSPMFSFMPAIFLAKPKFLVNALHDCIYRRYWASSVDYSHKKSIRQRASYCLDRLYYWLVERSIRKSDRVITVSEQSKNDIEKYLKKRMQFSIIPNWIDDDYESSGVKFETIKSIYNIDRDYIIYTGGLHERKNVGALARCFTEIAGRFPEVDLLLTGSPKTVQAQQILQIAASLGPGRARFIGNVAREHMSALYANSRLMVYPSLDEGFGLPPLEAMSCGCPVIASDLECIREFITNEKMLVDPRDESAMVMEMINALAAPEEYRCKPDRRYTEAGARDAIQESFKTVFQEIGLLYEAARS